MFHSNKKLSNTYISRDNLSFVLIYSLGLSEREKKSKRQHLNWLSQTSKKVTVRLTNWECCVSRSFDRKGRVFSGPVIVRS